MSLIKIESIGAIAVCALFLTQPAMAASKSASDCQFKDGAGYNHSDEHSGKMMKHSGDMMKKMHHGESTSGAMHGSMMGHGKMPRSGGQDMFTAIKEIVSILEADPNTDWSKVNISALREHLVDMNMVMTASNAVQKNIPGGISADVTGRGRTYNAIVNMIKPHSAQLAGIPKWKVSIKDIDNGMRLTVTSDDVSEQARIRGLGFYGIMTVGAHHQPHHLGMATGQMVH
ncbi:MAG: hypothetical protein KAQ66_03915 [Rhodospirillaceae bacterium]|nr:hypothetical protein [Rhodospirillaceae bacterium]